MAIKNETDIFGSCGTRFNTEKLTKKLIEFIVIVDKTRIFAGRLKSFFEFLPNTCKI